MSQPQKKSALPVRLGKQLWHTTHDIVFKAVHRNYLIYNTCWEDPRIDRQLLDIQPDSKIVMITSAGCNALDYLLDGPTAIHTIDVNPRQNALLELKLAVIKQGHFDDLFALFGEGYHPEARRVYDSVRAGLSPSTQKFWDKKLRYFERQGRKPSFYYHGSSGTMAWILTRYFFRSKKGLKEKLFALADAKSLEEQRAIYEQIEPELWGRFSSWLVKQPAAMAMLGVPRPQIRLVNERYPGGMAEFVNRQLRHVLTELPIQDNYFWRVYLKGHYTADCCPNYLKAEHLPTLQAHADRVHLHTQTITQFLHANPDQYTHFILLDHQDWLAWHDPQALAEEWDAILDNAAPGAKVMLRSAGETIDFIPERPKQAIAFQPEPANQLHLTDRVGTYASLHFGVVK